MFTSARSAQVAINGEAAQQTAAAAQALHAGTIQQQIEYKDKKEKALLWPWRKK